MLDAQREYWTHSVYWTHWREAVYHLVYYSTSNPPSPDTRPTHGASGPSACLLLVVSSVKRARTCQAPKNINNKRSISRRSIMAGHKRSRQYKEYRQLVRIKRSFRSASLAAPECPPRRPLPCFRRSPLPSHTFSLSRGLTRSFVERSHTHSLAPLSLISLTTFGREKTLNRG